MNSVAITKVQQRILAYFGLLSVLCGCAWAQEQSGSEGTIDDSNASWTVTQSQQPSGTQNPTQVTKSHSESGGRTLDRQSIQRVGVNGGSEPYMETEKESVKVDASTTRTVERTYGRDANGRKALIQVTEEEKQSLPGGEINVRRTTSDPDGNGRLQVIQREVQNAKQISPGVREIKTTILNPDLNGRFVPSVQSEERQTQSGEHAVEFRKSTRLSDANGKWRVSEVREGVIKDDGKSHTREESVLRPDEHGKLAVAERTMSKEAENTAGEKQETVESYSTEVPGSVADGGLHLNRRVTKSSRAGADGQQVSEEQVENRNPGNLNSGLRVTQKTIDIVRPAVGGGAEATRTLETTGSNGSFGVISVDTRKSDNTSAIQVDIAPVAEPK
jgi:hypothetical protein